MIDAKGQLEHGEFGQMIQRDLPFHDSTARRLMGIASHALIADGARVHVLPNHWGTLYELTKVPLPIREEALEDGRIHPEMERGISRTHRMASASHRKA